MKQEQLHEQERGRMPGIVTVAKSACEYLGIDYDIVFKPCRKVAGSSIEAIVLLMANMRATDSVHSLMVLPTDEVASIRDSLSKKNKNIDHNMKLRHIWSNMASSQLREFLQAMYSSPKYDDRDRANTSEVNSNVELQTGWFTIIHATRIGGSKSARFYDYVLGIQINEDAKADPSWVPIGKVKARPPQALAIQLDALLAEAVMERFGPTVSIKPSITVEVHHRGYRENRRTKAGRVLIDPEVVALTPGSARG